MSNTEEDKNNKPLSVSESTEISMPLKNLIAIAVGVSLLVGEYVILNDRIESLEDAMVRGKVDIAQNTEFRIFWPRGDLGQLPEDVEQSIRLDHLESDVKKMFDKIERLALMTIPAHSSKDH